MISTATQIDITLENILEFEQRYRATFINSLGGFKSLALIGTKSVNGQANLAVFNSLFHVGAHPPLFGFVVRPDSVDRHTLKNITETGEFTVNQVSAEFFMHAHQTSARYDADVSEFDATGLQEEYRPGCSAPFVKESAIKYSARLSEKINVALNGTIIVIGKVTMVSLPSVCLMPDGHIDIEKAGSITCSGLDAYYAVRGLGRLTYAKTDRFPQFLQQKTS
jgi:flavin reductase (DIM6/NTAB) family NADH-FMN oxidoreductase RutF